MSKRKDANEDSMIGSGRIGLAVMRMQVPHRGHMNLISRMKQDCDTVIIAFGSTQLSRVVRHPFTFEQRVEMVRAVFGDGFKPLPLVDIDSQYSTDDWCDYVLDKVRKLNLPEPTDFYTGSPQDAKWYVNRFAQLEDPMDEMAMTRSYHSDVTGKRLHIIDRALSTLPPAEELRSLIERRDTEWYRYVPERIIDFIERNYPPELRVAMQGPVLPPVEDVPLGTRFNQDGTLYMLHDDLKWRALTKEGKAKEGRKPELVLPKTQLGI